MTPHRTMIIFHLILQITLTAGGEASNNNSIMLSET